MLAFTNISVLEIYNNVTYDLLPEQRGALGEATECSGPISAAPHNVHMFSDQERCTHAVPAGQGKDSVEALRCRRKVLGSSGDVVDRAWVVVRSVEEAHKVLSKATSDPRHNLGLS